MKKLIIGEKIVKAFGEGDEKHKVLDGVSIEINEGEFVSVMGPSGSGKSTLMFALSGMESIDGGKVIFGDSDLSAVDEDKLADMRRKEMGFVFQQPTMLKNLSLLDNIILPSMSGKRKSLPEISERAEAFMKMTGIAELKNRGITQVSGGQLQRAGICRALINDPRIVFGDEPTGALNSKSAREIMDIFSRINSQGTAVMLVTHDAKVAARTERIMFMRDGKIVSQMKLPKYDGLQEKDRVEKVTGIMRELGI